MESLQANVARLKAYLEKLVVLPRKAGQPKKGIKGVVGDSNENAEDQVQANGVVLPLGAQKKRQGDASKITKDMRSVKVYAQLQLERMNKKWAGKRALRLEKKKE